MPEMDGFELLRAVRMNSDMEFLPVILLTAKVGLEDKLNGLELGANDYLTKPFEIKELIARIKSHVELKRNLVSKMLLEPNQIKVESEEDMFMKKVKMILEEKLSDTNLEIDIIADKLFISRSTLQKKIKKITGKNITTFIREYRLKRAKALIIAGYGNISEVAIKTGFNSVSYFSVSYKDYFGIPPTSSVNS